MIVLRCDQILLFDDTGDIFTFDGCAWNSYFCVPAETQSLPINIFAHKNTPLNQPGFEPITF